MALVNLISENITSCNPTFSNLPGFLDDKFSDITVTVSYSDVETKSYKLHRNILAGCSIFLHQSVECNQTMDITFMTPSEFEHLIIFMYTGKISFKSVSELCAGLYAANLLKLTNLERKCSENLQKQLEEDCGNALLILQFDERFNSRSTNTELFEMVDETIKKYYGTILRSGVMEKLEKNSLAHLLQMDSIQGTLEIEIFRALLKWTNARCERNGIERVPENLQEVAGDLINHIRYNLIPEEIFTAEIVTSGLLTEKFMFLIFQRYHNDQLVVPFCNRSRDNTDRNGATAAEELNQEQWQLESRCTDKEHLVNKFCDGTTIATLSWNLEKCSDWFSLPPAAEEMSTRWMIRFRCLSNGDIVVNVCCKSLDEQFRATSFRLFAVVEEFPHIWAETGVILRSAEEWRFCRFSGDVSELHEIRIVRIRVRLQWTNLYKLPHTSDLMVDGTLRVLCRWKLHGWDSVTPNSNEWCLYTEPFGRRGLLWRIIVKNKLYDNDEYDDEDDEDDEDDKDNRRQIDVQVLLQHLPASVDCSDLSMNCALSVWDENFDELEEDVKEYSSCTWTIIDDVQRVSRDPLDLNIIIRIGRKN